ncbi:tyrosine-type recombinase/integrase [Psychrobacter sp. Rd 27.2]|uniref:tyrosine-type recombinase/integrase n=1 Tax=Psychrobacter sp. Rd 27.2 TaxID=1926479 RepID=UPI000947290E|nr:tyrosine-type recombinase/integrase [Psychrobacter sp. Rd 27.2]OLF40507.1 site-specific recombinase [Psychrobacter sp. Rd 27.2]
MKKDGIATDQLVNTWVEGLLKSPNQLLALPLSSHLKSSWSVNITSEFLAKETSITINEANKRKHLTVSLIEKMAEMKVVAKGASSRENITRQRILYWYSNLSFNDKKNLPRLTKSINNVCFKSIGHEQGYWNVLATQYELVAKTIDEIHEDLCKLGIISTDYNTVESRKRLIKDAETAILEWVSRTIEDTETLWEIPISKAESALGFGIAVKHIQHAVVGVSSSAAQRYRELTNPLIEKMIKEGILVIPDGSYEAAGIESRRKLLNWYRQLSEKEKHTLPIFGNKISLRRMSSEQLPITKASLRFNVVRSAWDFIHKDLEKLGIIDPDYKSVAERTSEANVNRKNYSESQIERFHRLAARELNAADDFFFPSKLEPFIQIEQLFACTSKTVSSESGKSNYRIASNSFIYFLSELYGNSPLKIVTVFDEHLLSRYRKYLEKKIISKEISSYHANTLLSSVRRTLCRLTQVRDMEYSFFDINGFTVSRETDVKKPFTMNERIQVLDAIEKGLCQSRAALIPYKKTGIGKNPLNEKGRIIRGLSTLDNARWLFENPLMCKPVHYHTAESPIEISFLKITARSDKGLSEIYNEWGVTPMINMDILTPYLLRLAQITGLNTDSLLSLNVNDYLESHPATSRPCLRYWKERSDGYKEYHLDLFNAELTWLTSSQAKSIKIIFEELVQLTSGIRQDIEDDAFKDRLFIYQSDSTKKHGRVSPILGNKERNTKALKASSSKFVDKYNLKNDAGEPLTLTISRFRPTFVSEMLDSGVTLREIQLMLGHSSIQTTIGYLDSFDFNTISRVKLNDKLKEIHQSTLNKQTQEVQTRDTNELAITFHTPLAECRNIFDPPDFVKNLSSYIPGTPCSQYNKCLGCDNVIITAKNLPEIFAMKRDYTLLTEHTRVMDTPYGHVISENMELIKGITDPALSDFSLEDLKHGQRLAEYIETTTLVDGVI